MTNHQKTFTLGLWLLGAGLCVGLELPAAHAQAGLNADSNRSSFGRAMLEKGFAPDPARHTIRSGGAVHVMPLGLGAGCRGWVTADPDFIVHARGYSAKKKAILRFYVTATHRDGPRPTRDSTLVIRDPQGGWHCDDDSGGHFDPVVTVRRPRDGRYAIWVGSYERGRYVDGTLHITGKRKNGAPARAGRAARAAKPQPTTAAPGPTQRANPTPAAIQQALDDAGGHPGKAFKVLGLADRATLERLIEQHGLKAR